MFNANELVGIARACNLASLNEAEPALNRLFYLQMVIRIETLLKEKPGETPIDTPIQNFDGGIVPNGKPVSTANDSGTRKDN